MTTVEAEVVVEEKSGNFGDIRKEEQGVQDRTALVVRSMFRNEISEEVVKRQEKTKLNQTEKRRIENLILDRLSSLEDFLSRKMRPRVNVFIDYLEDVQSAEISGLKRQKNDLELKVQQVEAEKDEELEILRQEIEKKYEEKSMHLKHDLEAFSDRIVGMTRQHEKAINRLKSRFDERLHQFRSMTCEVRQVVIEKLWTQATTLREGQLLLDKIPNSVTFMDLMEKLAIESDDEFLKALLAGSIEERTEWYCDHCSSYGSVEEIVHDGESPRPNGYRDYDAGESKGKPLYICKKCKAEHLKENLSDMRSPFRMKTHEVIKIGEDESAKILELLRGEA